MIRLLMMFLLFGGAAMAQDTNDLDGRVAVSEDAVEDADSLYSAMQDIVVDLSDVDQRHFFGIYHTYALVGTVQTVRDDVGRAVQACGKENSDLAESMADRFDGWEAAVNPMIKEAKGQVDNMVIAQDYKKPKDITQFLNKIDAVRSKTAGSLSKVPVSSEKACRKLLKSMDKTQSDLVSMLKEALIMVPRSLTTGGTSE